jgi:seryl-tRNA synthetase
MIDINLIRDNKELVKENIKKKFQDHKLPLVDEAYELDIKFREYKLKGDNLRALKNEKSALIGSLMRDKKVDEANSLKEEVVSYTEELIFLEQEENKLQDRLKEIMMTIPNIIADSVPLGKDDSENVEVKVYGEKTKYDFEVPYHVEILEAVNGIDLESARRISGSGFYFLNG